MKSSENFIYGFLIALNGDLLDCILLAVQVSPNCIVWHQ